MDSKQKRFHHLCPWQLMWLFDNRFRTKIHPGKSIFSPYVSKGDTVLDLGCGIGGMSLELAKIVGPEGTVVAADIQQGALDKVESRAEANGLGNIIQTKLLNESENSFDHDFSFILCFWSAHESINPSRTIKNTYPILSSNGIFMLIEPLLHVSETEFKSQIQSAISVGYHPIAIPDISISQAMVFKK